MKLDQNYVPVICSKTFFQKRARLLTFLHFRLHKLLNAEVLGYWRLFNVASKRQLSLKFFVPANPVDM